MDSLRLALMACLLALPTLAWGQIPDGDPVQEPQAASKPAPAPAANNTLPECTRTLPALRLPLSFGPGEHLEYDLDAMGAVAGKMTFSVQKQKEGLLPIQAEVQTNTFFSKVRRVKATAISHLHPRTLRPSRYREDAVENEVQRKVSVDFDHGKRSLKAEWMINGQPSLREFTYDKDGLELAGAIYLLRQLPFKEGLPVCFDVYGVRRMWRVVGTVQKREHVSLPLGEFDAWYLQAESVRIDRPSVRRDLHVWISDDAQRLPLAALGTLDVGVVRATLTAVSRPGEKRRKAVDGKQELKW